MTIQFSCKSCSATLEVPDCDRAQTCCPNCKHFQNVPARTVVAKLVDTAEDRDKRHQAGISILDRTAVVRAVYKLQLKLIAKLKLAHKKWHGEADEAWRKFHQKARSFRGLQLIPMQRELDEVISKQPRWEHFNEELNDRICEWSKAKGWHESQIHTWIAQAAFPRVVGTEHLRGAESKHSVVWSVLDEIHARLGIPVLEVSSRAAKWGPVVDWAKQNDIPLACFDIQLFHYTDPKRGYRDPGQGYSISLPDPIYRRIAKYRPFLVFERQKEEDDFLAATTEDEESLASQIRDSDNLFDFADDASRRRLSKSIASHVSTIIAPDG